MRGIVPPGRARISISLASASAALLVLHGLLALANSASPGVTVGVTPCPQSLSLPPGPVATDWSVQVRSPCPGGLAAFSFLGGSNSDGGFDITFDTAGNLYAVGYTESASFPITPNAFDPQFNGPRQGFVAKMDPAAGTLLYSTFLGDSAAAEAVALDSAGNVYVTGYTTSATFPVTTNAFDPSFNGVDGSTMNVFVAKLNLAAGGSSDLLYGTYLGGSYASWPHDIKVDSAGNVYLAGYTYASDFPTTSGAFAGSRRGDYDGFVTKFAPLVDGSYQLAYSTYVGGSQYDEIKAMAVGTDGRVYVTGITISSDFPVTPGALDTTYNSRWNGKGPVRTSYNDAFVSKLNPAGGGASDLVYSTYLGGNSDDRGWGIAVDANGNAYVVGATSSSEFPVTVAAWDTSLSGTDAYLTKLAPDGGSLVFSTFIGGSGGESAQSLALDKDDGSIYVFGSTSSSDLPTTSEAFDSTFNGATDLFVIRITAAGNDIIYSTFLGGSGKDERPSVAVDAAGKLYMTGQTYSSDFPGTANAYDPSYNGVIDVFVGVLS